MTPIASTLQTAATTASAGHAAARRNRRPGRIALAAAAVLTALAATPAAQAVPVSVSIGGLPSGLSPVLTVKRNTCPDGMGFMNSPSQTLTEQNNTIIEQVTLPSGQVTFKSRVITRYVATFDTPATAVNANNGLERRCSTLGVNEDLFAFGLQIAGANAAGQPATLSASLGTTPQGPNVVLNKTMAAKTGQLIVVNQPQLTLARGMVHRVNAAYETSLGTVQEQKLDLLRPSNLFPGSFSRVVRLFVRSDGAACVQSGSTTRCLGESGIIEAGNVTLVEANRQTPGQIGWRFMLQQDFPIGTLRVSASANATDLDSYLVDGTLQEIDLLPWQAQSTTVTVQ